MTNNQGVPASPSGHSPKGGAASSTASPAKPSVPNADLHPAEDGEDHNPDGFVHATSKQAAIVEAAVARWLTGGSGPHERLMSALVAAMAAGARTPLHEIKVTVSAMDLDAELGALRVLRNKE